MIFPSVICIDFFWLLMKAIAISKKTKSNYTLGFDSQSINFFFSEVFYLINRFTSWRVVFSVDSGASFRDGIYGDYKKNRKINSSYFKALDPFFDIGCSLGFSFIKAEGFESDDVLFTFISNSRFEGFKNSVVVYSADNDLYQLLIRPNVFLLKKKKGTLFNCLSFEQQFDFLPERYSLYKSFVGDKTDNILGLARFKKKDALLIARSYKTMDEVFEFLNKDKFIEITQKKKDLILKNKDKLILNYALCKLREANELEQVHNKINKKSYFMYLKKYSVLSLAEKTNWSLLENKQKMLFF